MSAGPGAPHGPRCTCSICMPALTVGGAVVKPTKCLLCGQVGIGPCGCGFQQPKTQAEMFADAMAEIQMLRTARAVGLWRLFKLSLCQNAVTELRMQNLEQRKANADGHAMLEPQAE
jgi:hypothetical protein